MPIQVSRQLRGPLARLLSEQLEQICNDTDGLELFRIDLKGPAEQQWLKVLEEAQRQGESVLRTLVLRCVERAPVLWEELAEPLALLGITKTPASGPAWLRTAVAFSHPDQPLVVPLLDLLAQHGIRARLESAFRLDVRSTLLHALSEALAAPGCHSLTLFLSSSSQLGWREQELELVNRWSKRGGRLIAAWLDPGASRSMPGELRALLETHVDPHPDRSVELYTPDGGGRLVNALLDAASLRSTREVIFALAHRTEEDVPKLPQPWSYDATVPVLELRARQAHGTRDYTADRDELERLEAGLKRVKARLPENATVRVCGETCHGIAAMVGRLFDRGDGRGLEWWNRESAMVWPALERGVGATLTRAGERLESCQVEDTGFTAPVTGPVAAIYTGARADLFSQVRAHVEQLEPLQGQVPLFWLRTPASIPGAEENRKVVSDVVGHLRHLLEQGVHTLHWFHGLPLPTLSLAVRELRATGTIHLYDYFRTPPSYRPVLTLR